MLTVAATLAIFVYGLTAPMLGALLPSYALPPEQQGNLGLANALGLMIASLSAGPVVDLKGNKPVLLFGLGLVVAALLGAPNAGGYLGLVAVYFVLGSGGGVVVTGANSLVGDMAAKRRGSALNFANLFFGLGGIVTTFAASTILKPAALCYSAATLTATALAMNAVVKMPASKREVDFRLNEVRILISQPSLTLLSLLLFLYVACEVGVWNWLKAYLMEQGFDQAKAGGVVSYGFAFGFLVGRVASSRILIAVRAINVIMASGILMAVTTFAMLNLTSQGAITAAVFCAGLVMAPVFPTTLALVGDNFPRGTATAMGIAITSGWVGLAVSSRIIGSISATSTLRHALLLLPMFASAMVLVTTVLKSSLRGTKTA